MVRVALLLIVSLLAPGLPALCVSQAPASHDCCRETSSATPQAFEPRSCCVSPAMPTQAVPRATGATPPAVSSALVVLRRYARDAIGDAPLRTTTVTPGLTYLRHVALLI